MYMASMRHPTAEGAYQGRVGEVLSEAACEHVMLDHGITHSCEEINNAALGFLSGRSSILLDWIGDETDESEDEV